MSLHPLAVYRVPEETARVVHAAFPQGHPWARQTILQRAPSA